MILLRNLRGRGIHALIQTKSNSQATLFIFALLWVGYTGQVIGEDRVIFTEPECQTYSYADAVPLVGGGEIQNTRGGFFCTSKDFSSSPELAEGSVGKEILKTLKNSDEDRIQSVRMAVYIFSDLRVAEFLCAQASVSPFNLTVYTQKSSKVGLGAKVSEHLSTCFGDNLKLERLGCDIFAAKDCPGDKVNTMHLKLIEVRRESGQVSQIVSSGNLGRGMYANLEDWLFFDSVKYNSMQDCVWPILSTSLKNTVAALKDMYSQCKARQGIIAGSKMILLPFEADEYYQEFKNAALTAQQIDIVSMDFKDVKLKRSLMEALNKGAIVNFYPASDWYFAHVSKEHQGTAGSDEIGVALDLQKKHPNQVSLNFIETNFFYGVGNTLHHKFALFKGASGNTVLAGTTNMNASAIRRNLDQAYIFDNDLADAYSDYVGRLKKRSIPYEQMPVAIPVLSH